MKMKVRNIESKSKAKVKVNRHRNESFMMGMLVHDMRISLVITSIINVNDYYVVTIAL